MNHAALDTPNRMARRLAGLSRLPAALQPWARNWVLRRAVPFTGTAGLDFVALSPQASEIAVANRPRVQNHIQGVHAAATALLAETATGMVVGMNVRDDCLPLCKSLHVDFRKRATGAMRARASLTQAQRDMMRNEPKGEVSVAVVVTDEAGIHPVECEFVWAWIPKPARN